MYCMKCRKSTESNDLWRSDAKNRDGFVKKGVYVLHGTCDICHCKKAKLTKASEELEKLPSK